MYQNSINLDQYVVMHTELSLRWLSEQQGPVVQK